MKKISRLLAIFLILLMLGSLSVSCKKKPADEDEAIVDTEDEGNTENSGNNADDTEQKDEGAKDDKQNNKKEDNKKGQIVFDIWFDHF